MPLPPGTFFVKNKGVQYCEIIAYPVPQIKRTAVAQEFTETLKSHLTKIPIADITIKARESGGGNKEADPLQIEITGENLVELNRIADQVEAIASSTSGAVDIRSSWNEGVPELQILSNRNVLADYGISVARFSSAIRASIEGNIATQYRVGKKEYDVRVQLDKSYIPFANMVFC